MEEKINKRKIKNIKKIEGKYKHEKKQIIKEEVKEENIIGKFQLVVIKLPWYKKAWRSLKNFLGFGYEF